MPAPSRPIDIEARANNGRDNLDVDAEGDGWATVPAARTETPGNEPQDKFIRADDKFCMLIDLDSQTEWAAYLRDGCESGDFYAVDPEPCPEGTFRLAPLLVMHPLPDGSYTQPALVDLGACAAPANLAAEAARAFSTMHVPDPPATLQTGDPTTLLVNAWYPAYTTDDPVTQQVTLLDVPVEIRAIPAEFTWDFDDPFSETGPTLTTTNPGREWHQGDDTPDQTWTAHAWTRLGNPDRAADRAQGTAFDDDADAKYRTDVTVTLTTTWHGQYRITGSPTWTDIPGQLTTTSTAGTYLVSEAPTKLYCDDLTGHSHCRD